MFFHYSVFQQNWQLRPAPIMSTVAWKEVKVGGRKGNEARRHGTYSGAKRSIEKCWFPVNANCFHKCIFMQRIKYSWILHIIRELSYTNPRPYSPSEKKITTLCKEQVRTRNNALQLPIFLSHSFWTDWAPAVFSRPPLCWLVTHKEHNSTQPPIPLKNTTVYGAQMVQWSQQQL
jgi:hypothetical protein